MLFRILRHRPPHVLMMIDVYGWAFHALSKGMKNYLPDYTIDISTSKDNPDYKKYDIIHAFGIYQNCENARCPVLKGVYNTNGTIRTKPVSEIICTLTEDATALTAPTESMRSTVLSFGITKPVHLLPEGVDTNLFSYSPPYKDTLRIGWAGNPARCSKRFYIAQQACDGVSPLHVADGTLSEQQVIDFYGSLDIILCTSEFGEGCPRPLIEAMSRGCFPVSFPVGVAPDIIIHEQNGLLVQEETVQGMQQALRWCASHTEYIRSQRKINHAYIRNNRGWPVIAPILSDIYRTLLSV